MPSAVILAPGRASSTSGYGHGAEAGHAYFEGGLCQRSGNEGVTEGSLSAEETSLGDELYCDTRILYALVNESTCMQTRTHNNRKITHSQSHTHTIKDTHSNTHDHTCIPMHVYLSIHLHPNMLSINVITYIFGKIFLL